MVGTLLAGLRRQSSPHLMTRYGTPKPIRSNVHFPPEVHTCIHFRGLHPRHNKCVDGTLRNFGGLPLPTLPEAQFPTFVNGRDSPRVQ